MNDLLKFLSKSLIPFGYHIRPYKGLNFLKIPSLEHGNDHRENIVSCRKNTKIAPQRDSDTTSPISLTVFLRTCIRDNRNTNHTPRLTGQDDLENVLRCTWSLIKSLNNAKTTIPEAKIKLIILDDRSSDHAQKSIKTLLKECQYPAEIRTTESTGQGASLHQQFRLCKEETGLVYCVEDDYLHEPDAIERLVSFYQQTTTQTKSPIILYPQEHGILYTNHYPSYILASKDGHWRSIRHATHTFLTHAHIIQKNWDCFENTKYVGIKKKRRLGSEAKTTNRLFDKYPGFSPLKPCAVHLQYESLLPPYYDWRPLWEASNWREESENTIKDLQQHEQTQSG